MENPAKLSKQAETKDLVAAQALRDQAVKDAAAAKRKASTSDSERNKSDEFNVQMKKLYETHLIDTKYDCHTPVFVDPGNPNRYILLTVDAC